MLSKLFKYDFKSFMKSIIPCYIILILVTLIYKLTSVLDTLAVFKVMNKFMLFALIVIIIANLFATLFISVKYFYQNVFKDEGYLTNTLPVKRKHIYDSKIIVSLFFMILTTILIVLSIIISFGYSEINTFLTTTIKPMLDAFEMTLSDLIIFIIVTVFISYISYLTIFYTAITIGCSKIKDKLQNSLIYGVLLYLGTQIVGVLSLLVAFLIKPNILDDLNKNIPSNETFQLVMISSYIATILIAVIYYYIGYKFYNKKLNLD